MTVDPYAGLGLPPSVTARIKNRPIEDILLAIFRRGLPGVPVYTLIPEATPPTFLLVRQVAEAGLYDGQHPLLDSADFAVHVFAEDPDGDEKAALVGDAVVDVGQEAFVNHWSFPSLGSINYLRCTQKPSRVTDWATSSGPVQYADLPTGDWRYEARFRIRINPPRG